MSSKQRCNSKDWRFLPDRAKDPSTLLASQNETLPRTGYFTNSRVRSSQAVVIYCSGIEDTGSVVVGGGTPEIEVSEGTQRWCSWSDAKPNVREKLVEEQLAFSHKEYCRLFRGASAAGAKGGGRGETQPPPCRSCADPTPDYLRTVVIHMRRLTTTTSGKERVVFHYIHHRAPPDAALCHEGHLLLYCQDSNEHKTLEMKSVHEELATPAAYIFDCPYAGRLITSLNQLLSPEDDVIALGTCGEYEALPWDRFGLPVDLFTACLMSPIRVALNFYRVRGATVLSDPLQSTLQSLTGKLQDRNTPLGELASIFTAIADAIAWSSFEPKTFKRLFREDGALAELSRNFLLAQRILHAFDLHATSRPELPATHSHHLWDVWDSALELLLVRLSKGPSPPLALATKPQTFFEEQMAAFWAWLRFHPELSGLSLGSSNTLPEAPVELPIVMQGLLHPDSRLEALRLLACFVDLGVGAVHFTLLVGARPYLTKLLSHDDFEETPEVAPLALLVWTKMLTFDPFDKEKVMVSSGYKSFYNLAKSQALPSYHRAFACFCLAVAAHDRPTVKAALLNSGVLHLIASLLSTSKQLMLLWMAALLCGEVCRDCNEVAVAARDAPVAQALLDTLSHSSQEVRASCIYAIGCILGASMTPRKVEESGVLSVAATAPDLEMAVPLFRRFLGLGATGHASDSASAFAGTPPVDRCNRWLWLASSMIWHFSSKTSQYGSLHHIASSSHPGGPDCAILNETSMLVRYEVICALSRWVGDLSVTRAGLFAYFDSLPSAPWDIDTPSAPSSSSFNDIDEPAPLSRSAPSCPNFTTKLQGSICDDAGSPAFESTSIMYAWSVNCLQQPNALSHAVDYDITTAMGETYSPPGQINSRASLLPNAIANSWKEPGKIPDVFQGVTLQQPCRLALNGSSPNPQRPLVPVLNGSPPNPHRPFVPVVGVPRVARSVLNSPRKSYANSPRKL